MQKYALDPKVFVRAAWVVGGGEDEAAIGFAAVAVADHCRDGGRAQQAVLADPDLGDAVGGGDLENDLHRFLAVIASVARHH